MKIAKSPLGLACTINDPTGVIGASFDARLSLSVEESARLLGHSPTTTRRLIARGLLKPMRHLRHLQIPASQLIQLAGGDGQVIHVPAKSTRTRKHKKSSPAPTPPGPLEYDPRWPFLPGLSPDEVLATQETQKGGCS